MSRRLKPGFTVAVDTVRLTPAEVVSELRDLHGMTQAELAKATKMSQPAIAAIERGTITLGADRARRLAVALKVHPSVILFPHWDEVEIAAVKKEMDSGDTSRTAGSMGRRATAREVVKPVVATRPKSSPAKAARHPS